MTTTDSVSAPNVFLFFKDKRIHGKRPTNYIHFDSISRIAREAATLNPAVNIATLAYNNTLKYPTGLDIAPNVGIQMFITPYDFWVNYDGSAKKYQEWIDNGEAKKRLLTVWTYMFSGDGMPNSLIKMNFSSRCSHRNIRQRSSGNLRRTAFKAGSGKLGRNRNAFLALSVGNLYRPQTGDNPTQDSTQMINEFFTLYYGAAAVP
ncbi:MAG: hypothetical protein V8T87_07765 [Victivallales bacterium]